MAGINEDTKISLGLLVAFAAVVFWTGVLYFKVETTAEAVGKLEERTAIYERMLLRRLINIDSRLSRIEGQIGLPIQRLPEDWRNRP